MKILFIYTLYKDTLGGGGKISQDLLAAELRKKGHEVIILTTRKVKGGIASQVVTLSGVIALIPDNVLKLGTRLTDWILARAITRAVRVTKPDVIHVQDDYILPAVVRADLADTPVVATMRQPVDETSIHNRGWLPGVAHLYLKRLRLNLNCLKQVDLAIAISDFIRNGLNEAGAKAVTIYNLPPPWSYVPLEKRDPEIVRIISPGRVTVCKGFGTLLRAAGIVRREADNFELLIVGDGPYMPSLRKLVDEYGLADRVQLTGDIEYADMEKLYREADLVVFPTEVPEAMGRISLEGMVMGRPVIASRIGAVPEIVEDGETGILFKPGDYRELASAMIRLIVDREARIAMGKKGREVINRKVDRNKIVESHLESYRRLITARKTCRTAMGSLPILKP